MGAAEHGAEFPMAQKLRESMSMPQLHDFAVGPMAQKPEHVLQGSTPDIAHANVQSFKRQGLTEHEAVKRSIRKSNPNSHKNLGKFLHPRKDGKPHGSDIA